VALLFAALAVPAVAVAAPSVDGDLRKQVKDPDSFKRSDAARALGKLDTAAAAQLLLDLLIDKNPYVRDHTVKACGKLRSDEALAVLAKFKSKDPLARANLVAALGATKTEAGLEALNEIANHELDSTVRAALMDAIWGYRGHAVADNIAAIGYGDDDPLVRAAAVEAAGRIRSDEPHTSSVSLTMQGLIDEDVGVRCVALMEQRFVLSDTTEIVARAARDPDWRIRAQAVENAFWLHDDVCMGVLVEAVGDERLRVAAAAHSALIGLSGTELGRDTELWKSWWEANRDTWKAPDKPRFGVPPKGAETRASYHGIEILSENVVFVLDASGSMSNEMGDRTRWELARAELDKAVEGLPDGTPVNVVVFQEEAKAAFDAPKPLTKKVRRDIHSFARKTSPRESGNLLAAMLLALEQEGADTVFLLSDGAPSFGDMVDKGRVRRAIRARNRSRKLVVNTIGLGAEKSTERSFLEGVARDSGGRAVFR
jgi:HEAT repeat protein